MVRYYRWALDDARRDRSRVATALVKNRDYQEAMRILRPEEEWYPHALLHDPGRLRIDRVRFLTGVTAAPAPAQSLARIYGHFQGAAPALVAGLSPE